MSTSPTPYVTNFSRDVLGRYICNGLDEALHSSDPNAVRPDGSPQRDARPFDVIVIGGGSFGGALAAHIFHADQAHRRRILVLEGGPFMLTEHVQDLPMLGLDVPAATSIADLRGAGQAASARNEVWGLAWHANTAFPGLAYSVGGRSLYWGGWSPRLLDEEMPTDGASPNAWPSDVAAALNGRYFQEASEQLGVDEANDFIFGPLQNALRRQLFEALRTGPITDAIPLDALPDHPAIRNRRTPPTRHELIGLLGLSNSEASAFLDKDLLDLLKLEAPLAVQRQTLSGLLPFNKFSAVPLLIQASRAAQSEARNDDVKKRLMIVPNCHVKRLITARAQGGLNVVGIETNQGFVPVPPAAPVVIALGTIESTRLILQTLRNEPNSTTVGKNLLAHLRSNLTIRIPRSALKTLDPAAQGLSAAALFFKGRHTHADGSIGHFHLQITAAGLGPTGTDSEAELFKKIPDIDTFDLLRTASSSHLVITIRGIGEMEPNNPDNAIHLDPENDEYGQPRAFVSLTASAKDRALWDAMDKAALDVAKAFAGSEAMELLSQNRDGLGTTHHEAGTLRMGTAADSNGRLRDLSNAFVAGPALFPRTGSPNPMLTGIALARRLGDHLVSPAVPYAPTDDSTPLFDGFRTEHWRMSTIRNQPGRDDPGRFVIVDGALESVPGSDLGLYWCTIPTPANFILKLEWLRWEEWSNSGVFLRFPYIENKGYNNSAWVAVDYGFEIQIDELGAPDGAGIHKTGAIYGQAGQTLTQHPAHPVGAWNEFEIHVQGQTYTVFLNGAQVSEFTNADPNRGIATTRGEPTYIGLQTHTGRVAFRNIRLSTPLTPPPSLRRTAAASSR